MASLSRFLHSATTFLVENFGLGGLFVVALLDSSFLSLPEVNDILVVTLSLADRDRFWLYALVAALGSTTGCAALHALGKNGGRAILQRRVSPARIAKLQATFRRFDLFAVLVPSLLPPPCPFKIFVLASGVFGMSYARFLVTVMVGRSVRYLSAALARAALRRDLPGPRPRLRLRARAVGGRGPAPGLADQAHEPASSRPRSGARRADLRRCAR